MYRVLLVDDEYLDLLGLESLVPWHDYDMEIAGAVKNGFEAMQLLQQKTIDLLVTDIRMPNMTGLELAELARSYHPQMKIMFVSGHQDFQYARQAIEMHASSYVLKPVDDQELFQQLQLVKGQLDREREQAQRAAFLPLAQAQVLQKWFEGTLNTLSVRAFLGDHPLLCANTDQPSLQVSLIEVDDVAWKLQSVSDEERASLVQRVADCIEQFTLQQQGLCCHVAEYKIALLLPSSRLNQYDTLITQVCQETTLSITIGLGTPVSTLGEIPRSYQEARKALASKMFVGKARCITYQHTRLELVQHAANLDHKFTALFNATANYDLPAIHTTLDDLFSYVTRLQNNVSVYNFALYVLSKLDAYLRTLNENLDTLLGTPIFNLAILYAFETIEDIKGWLREQMDHISTCIHQKKQTRGRKLIQEIETYIVEHISHDFTLRDVAHQFGFSPNYLGHLFKEETGETFTEYVIRKRLERATELLRDPSLKLYEIAYRLGYSNLTYFGRQFKEAFGQTPGEYRRHL